MSKSLDNTDIRQKMNVDDDRYHARKLGFGGHGTHEGWIQAEEVSLAINSAVSVESRHKMIELAAYYHAKQHGFSGQSAFDDWIKAEAEVDEKLHEYI